MQYSLYAMIIAACERALMPYMIYLQEFKKSRARFYEVSVSYMVRQLKPFWLRTHALVNSFMDRRRHSQLAYEYT